ncbi:putative membrane protein YdeH [Lentibacillus sp. JNUCC-1]|uniref:hypothetical protein n=1 Tax=Lentibacillus sp. JNUCC-1 TaxID=2654513 RepID=UPI0012E81994|nr:hypothetical protein [Lentibacillus sp. JNUCC-1]MUV38219.1 putative membrane protein YdeH [Lentibacillus sp. JNUCC-1]
MFKRFLMVVLTLIAAVGSVLLAAKHPTGPNSVSYDEPIGLSLSIGMIVVLFLPPLILSLFGHRVVRIISAVYQFFIVISFMGTIPISFLLVSSIGMTAVAVIGTLLSIVSVVITLKTTCRREIKV